MFSGLWSAFSKMVLRPIFAIFLFSNGRGPGKLWGKEVRELIYSFSHVPPFFVFFFWVALSNGLTGRLASLPYVSALLATPIPG